jgi:hypothetical protein
MLFGIYMNGDLKVSMKYIVARLCSALQNKIQFYWFMAIKALETEFETLINIEPL